MRILQSRALEAQARGAACPPRPRCSWSCRTRTRSPCCGGARRASAALPQLRLRVWCLPQLPLYAAGALSESNRSEARKRKAALPAAPPAMAANVAAMHILPAAAAEAEVEAEEDVEDNEEETGAEGVLSDAEAAKLHFSALLNASVSAETQALRVLGEGGLPVPCTPRLRADVTCNEALAHMLALADREARHNQAAAIRAELRLGKTRLDHIYLVLLTRQSSVRAGKEAQKAALAAAQAAAAAAGAQAAAGRRGAADAAPPGAEGAAPARAR